MHSNEVMPKISLQSDATLTTTGFTAKNPLTKTSAARPTNTGRAARLNQYSRLPICVSLRRGALP